MNRIILFVLLVFLIDAASAQNIGIGIDSPVRAKFEVWGVAGTGKTAAILGDDKAVSILRGNPGIGLNIYSDNNNVWRNISDGYAARWELSTTSFEAFNLYLYPFAAANAIQSAGTRVWTIDNLRHLTIFPPAGFGYGMLEVGRGTGNDGTAMFLGTEFHSHINFSTAENTYIRGGKTGSTVVLNDIPSGKVIFGNGAATVGINTNGYIPPATLEVRQANGGMEITYGSLSDRAWEWRVGSGATPNYYLYFAGGVRGYFSTIDGSYNPISDSRLKENIVPLGDILDKLAALKPVTYRMKDASPGSLPSIGFIAQDVQKLFPLLVTEMKEGDESLLTVTYSVFGVIAIKGIQEEQMLLDKVASRLSDMEQRMKAIEQKLQIQNK